MISFYSILSTIFVILTCSAFILPLWLFFKSIRTKIYLYAWISSILFYLGYSLILPLIVPFPFAVLSSTEMISLVTISFTCIIYLIVGEKKTDILGFQVLLCCEIILSEMLLRWINSKTGYTYSLWTLIVFNIFVFLFSFVFGKLDSILFSMISKSKKQLTFITASIILIILYVINMIVPIVTTYNSIIIEGNQRQSNHLIASSLSFLLALLLGAIILAGIIIRDRIQQRKITIQKQREKNLEGYIHMMESMQLDIRKFHHDYQNMIISLGGYLESSPIDEVGMRNFYDKLLGSQQDSIVKTVHLTKLKSIHIAELKGLIMAKLIQANKKGVQINFEIEKPIKSIPMDEIDLTRVVGNLLDNAIEGTLDFIKPSITIAFFYIENQLFIAIENTTSSQTLPMVSQTMQRYSTKGKNRGLGLMNIYEILEEYPKIALESSLENSKFKQVLIFDLA